MTRSEGMNKFLWWKEQTCWPKLLGLGAFCFLVLIFPMMHLLLAICSAESIMFLRTWNGCWDRGTFSLPLKKENHLFLTWVNFSLLGCGATFVLESEKWVVYSLNLGCFKLTDLWSVNSSFSVNDIVVWIYFFTSKIFFILRYIKCRNLSVHLHEFWHVYGMYSRKHHPDQDTKYH